MVRASSASKFRISAIDKICMLFGRGYTDVTSFERAGHGSIMGGFPERQAAGRMYRYLYLVAEAQDPYKIKFLQCARKRGCALLQLIHQ